MGDFRLGLAVGHRQRLAVLVDRLDVGHALHQADDPQPRLPGRFERRPASDPPSASRKIALGDDRDRLEAERPAVAGPAGPGDLLVARGGHHADRPLLGIRIDRQPGLIQQLIQRRPEGRLVEVDRQLRIGRRLAELLGGSRRSCCPTALEMPPGSWRAAWRRREA